MTLINTSDNVRFVKITSYPGVPANLTAQYYVDEALHIKVDESPLLGLKPDEELNVDQQDSITLNSFPTSTTTITEIPAKAYVDGLHENSRNRRDKFTVLNDQANEFDNSNLLNLDSFAVNIGPIVVNDFSEKN